jgi:hypothetical protein
MKIKNILTIINNLLHLILTIIKISIIISIVYFVSIFYKDIVNLIFIFKNDVKLPSYTLSDVTIIVDDNFNNNSKSFIQKLKEKFLNDNKQQIKISYNKNIVITIDGSLEIEKSNQLLKDALCNIYKQKFNLELDLNKKRVFDVLKNLYCI